ncbi:uncharacterized protein LOC127129804 [Lathyrus oleraceus]|uniref:uncharacterized protein LOC127129804 n=1 Tax=Pisum sativum TaxID=3888 RepID=UPI0021D12C2F|nr:uncharacterized protein LOC127129804 [Pisum sativum]
MKSGDVISEEGKPWYEPDWWKFGDEKSYFRHASGSLVILSKNLAQYININSVSLKTYAYKTTYSKAVCIQTGMRGMAARNELRFRKRTLRRLRTFSGNFKCGFFVKPFYVMLSGYGKIYALVDFFMELVMEVAGGGGDNHND